MKNQICKTELILWIPVLLMVASTNLYAQEEKDPSDSKGDWIGQYVMPRIDAEFQRDGETIQLKDVSVPLLVTDADEDLLYLESKGRAATIARDQAILLDDSLDYYEEEIARHPDALRPYIFKACVYLHQKDYDSCSFVIEKAVEIDVKSVLTRRVAGSFYYAQAEYELAKEQYELVLEDYPDDTAILSSVANCNVLLGDAQTALELFDKAISLEKMGVYYTGRAQAHRMLGNYGAALRDARFGIKKASENDSDSWKSTAQIILAYCYYYTDQELSNPAKALDAMLLAYELKPFERADFFQLTVSLCRETGNEEELERFEKLQSDFQESESSLNAVEQQLDRP